MAPEEEGNYWKCIMNKNSKSATRKDAGRTGTECRFWSRAAKISWREILTYSTGLIKHSDYRSRGDFLNFNNSVATFEIESIFNMVLEGREEKGSTGKVVKLKYLDIQLQ